MLHPVASGSPPGCTPSVVNYGVTRAGGRTEVPSYTHSQIDRLASINRRDVPTGTHNSQTMRDSQKKIWNMLSAVHGEAKSRQLSRNIPSAQDFLDFFRTKLENVCKNTGHGAAMTFLPAATPRMEPALHGGGHPCNHKCGTVEIM